jgi:hypothetical protein
MQGRIIKWSGSFGFVRSGSQTYFVHKNSFLSGSTPEMFSQIEFRLGPSHREDKPPQAVHVRTIKTATEVLAETERAAGIEALLKGKVEEIADTNVLRFEEWDQGGAA